MQIEDLKKIQPIPGFDCVKMKHDIQARIYEDTKDMTRAERSAYRQRRVAAFRAGIPWPSAYAAEPMAVREEPAAHGAKQVDFWKQFKDAPSIDCVKMKHDIQAGIYDETKDMSREERMAYKKKKAAAFRARMK